MEEELVHKFSRALVEIKALKKQIQRLREANSRSEGTIQELSSTIEDYSSLEGSFSDLTKLHSEEVRDLNEQIHSLEREKVALKLQVSSLEARNVELKQMVRLEEEGKRRVYEESVEGLDTLKSMNEDLMSRVTHLEASRQLIQDENTRLGRLVEKLEVEVHRQKEDFDIQAERYAAAIGEARAELVDVKTTASSERQIINTLTSKLNFEEQENKSLIEKLEDKSILLSRAEEKLKRMSDFVEQLQHLKEEEKQSAAELLSNEITLYRSRIDDLERTVSEKDRQIERLNDFLKQADEERMQIRLEAVEFKTRAESLARAADERVDTLNKQVKMIKLLKTNSTSCEKEKRILADRTDELERKLAHADNKNKQLQKIISEREQIFSILSDIQEKREQEKERLYKNTLSQIENIRRDDPMLLIQTLEIQENIPSPFEAGFLKTTDKNKTVEKGKDFQEVEFDEGSLSHDDDFGGKVRAMRELERMLQSAIEDSKENETPELRNYIEALQIALSKMVHT